MHHNSRPHPRVRPGGQSIQAAWQCILGSLAHLLLTLSSKCFPQAPPGTARPNLCSAPRSHIPALQLLMVTPDAHNPNPSPAPTRPAIPFPTSRRRYDPTPPGPRPPGRSPGCGGRRWRELGQRLLRARAGAGGGPRRTARYCFQNTPAPGIPQTADEAPPLLASLQPLTNDKWSSKSQAGQLPGTVTNVRTFPWKHYKGPSAFLTFARSAIGAPCRVRIRFQRQAPEAPESPWVLH